MKDDRFLQGTAIAESREAFGELADGEIGVRHRVVERENLRVVELKHAIDDIRSGRVHELERLENLDVIVDRIWDRLGKLLPDQRTQLAPIDRPLGHIVQKSEAAKTLHLAHLLRLPRSACDGAAEEEDRCEEEETPRHEHATEGPP